MPKKNQDIIFYKSEGDKYFERNGPRINKSILKAVKFLSLNLIQIFLKLDVVVDQH